MKPMFTVINTVAYLQHQLNPEILRARNTYKEVCICVHTRSFVRGFKDHHGL